MKKQSLIIPNTNDNSTDDYEISPSGEEYICDTVKNLQHDIDHLAKIFKFLHKNRTSIVNNDKIYKALEKFTSNKNVMYIAGLVEGSRIAPLTKLDLENRKWSRKAIAELRSKIDNGETDKIII